MKKIFVSLAMIALLAAGCSSQSNNSNKTDSTPSNTNTNTETSAGTSSEYTMAQVQQANSPSKCWSVINSDVYDLTSWASKHPGGKQAILSICGKDGTSAFNGQHGNQPQAETTLQKYKIGTLKK